MAAENTRLVSMEEVMALAQKARAGQLDAQTGPLAGDVLETYAAMVQELQRARISIHRLQNLAFGAATETSARLFGKEKPKENDAPPTPPAADTPKDKPKPPGHGRNGADSFTGAERKCICHDTLKPGQECPLCGKGKLYELKPAVRVKIIGGPPLSATRFDLQRLRCNLCGEVFRTDPPPDLGEEDCRYEVSAIATLILLKYGMGMPFYRLETFQKLLGVPLPASTQWLLIERAAPIFLLLHAVMLDQAANGELFHNDDTPVKVLELAAENRKAADGPDPPKRKGMFTSAVIAKLGTLLIALFFSGRKHAGENLRSLLDRRRMDLSPPLQMCDGLDRNLPGEFAILLANCLAHARRNFVDIKDSFPAECQHVIGLLARVYWFDGQAKKLNLDPDERMRYHQENSGPLMAELHAWMKVRLDEKLTEPNSGLGQAIRYALKRWKALTRFLETPGAPLDNNICEQALKMTIRSRKNSFFYKTMWGAQVGDMFMSFIHTCKLCEVNPQDYFVAVLEHQDAVAKDLTAWMPWNYKAALTAVA